MFSTCLRKPGPVRTVVQVRVSSREDADYGERLCGRPSPWRASGQLHVPPELVWSGRVVAVPDAGPCPAGRLICCEDLLATNWRLKEMPKICQVSPRFSSRFAKHGVICNTPLRCLGPLLPDGPVP